MKKVYQQPSADLRCFRPVQALANGLDFNAMLQIKDNQTGVKGTAANFSKNDISISF
jgi:hypothetical protein